MKVEGRSVNKADDKLFEATSNEAFARKKGRVI